MLSSHNTKCVLKLWGYYSWKQRDLNDRLAAMVKLLIQNHIKFYSIVFYIICSGWYVIAMSYVQICSIQLSQQYSTLETLCDILKSMFFFVIINSGD
jgi:hypothetical protein